MNTLLYNKKGVSPPSGAYVAPCIELQRRTKLYVPRSLELETRIIDAGFIDWLEPARIEKLLWLISKICKAWYLNETTNVGCFVNIPSKLIRKKLHWRFAGEAVEVLTALGIVETNGKYSVGAGGFSKSFRLAKEFWNASVVIIEGSVKTEKDESVIKDSEQEWILESLRRTEFDEPSFRATITPQMPAKRLLRAER